MISSNTTLKAVAVKDGYLDSAYSATVFEIAGDTVSSSDNLGLKKKTTASSSKGANTADMASMVQQTQDGRPTMKQMMNGFR